MTASTASPGAAFSTVIGTAVEYAAAKLSLKVDDWTESLNGIAAGGDTKQRAGSSAARAGLRGKNPVWAAVKGAWSGGSATVKAAIVTAMVSLVLLLVLSPVLLLVFALAALIIAAVHKARSARS